MKKQIKKVVAVVLSVFLGIYSNVWNAYGDIYVNNNQVSEGSLEKFIEEEKETNTGLIDEEVENDLNDLGVFDSEIEQFDDETLRLLNEGHDYFVNVMYYEETDDGLEKLTDNEVEEYFEEIYEEGKEDDMHEGIVIEETETEDNKSIFEALGLVENVYAKTRTDETNKIKFVLTGVQTSKQEIYISAQAQWKENPTFRGSDYIGVYAHGKDSVYEACKARYASANYSYNMKATGGSVKADTTRLLESAKVITNSTSNAIGAHIYLKGDTPGRIFSSHVVTIGGYFFVNDYDKKGVIDVGMQYVHQKKKVDGTINAGLSVNAGGQIVPSVLITGKKEDYFHFVETAAALHVTTDFDPSKTVFK